MPASTRSLCRRCHLEHDLRAARRAAAGSRGSGVNGIYIGPNPVTDTVVETSGPLDLFSDPAITENGSVIFWGALAASGGIFSGPADALFGSTVAGVNMRARRTAP